MIPRVLSIAGSDSGGGAGIQADLRAFAACGVHGMTAVTAVTAQNTVGVAAVQPVRPDMIIAQVRAVAEDIGIDAVKIGMLGDEATVEAVAEALTTFADGVPVVLDPVMVSESGAVLLRAGAQQSIVSRLFPLVTVITPNLDEARTLAAADPRTRRTGDRAQGEEEEVHGLAGILHSLGARNVLITGGHRSRLADVLFDGQEFTELTGVRHADGAGHGSGCTHSSVLAARLAWGDPLVVAAGVAREMAAEAVRDGLREIGAGAGPVNVLGLGRRG